MKTQQNKSTEEERNQERLRQQNPKTVPAKAMRKKPGDQATALIHAA
jgi:hypothetical protein